MLFLLKMNEDVDTTKADSSSLGSQIASNVLSGSLSSKIAIMAIHSMLDCSCFKQRFPTKRLGRLAYHTIAFSKHGSKTLCFSFHKTCNEKLSPSAIKLTEQNLPSSCIEYSQKGNIIFGHIT